MNEQRREIEVNIPLVTRLITILKEEYSEELSSIIESCLKKEEN